LLNKELFLSVIFDKSTTAVSIKDSLFLIGSCFSESISQKLIQRKFNVMSNPYGVLYDTLSIEKCIEDIIFKKEYSENELFFHNELFGSWSHHSDFSNINSKEVVGQINQTIINSESWLRKTKTILITLGSAFSYFQKAEKRYVANCHKLPHPEFNKELISIERIVESLKNIQNLILSINPTCNLVLTISPVRHLRDGVVENNRSKARLIEAVNIFTSTRSNLYYFPSYEIIIDILRDYRFFDSDFAHPNILATDIVFNYFLNLCIDPTCFEDIDRFHQLYIASKHRPRNPDTLAHKKFLEIHLEKAKEYQAKFPALDFSEELNYFSSRV
jgi:hypothetical protein